VTRQDLFVSVVAPLGDDADIVTAFVEEVVPVLTEHYLHAEIVLVDDGSRDGTVDVVDALLRRFPIVRLLRLSRRFGPESAISAGLETAIGDFVVVMLPDCDPPSLIPTMVSQCRDGAGIVHGIRADRRGDPWHLSLGSRLFYGLVNRAFQLQIPPNSTHFRALSRQAVNAILQVHSRNRYLRAVTAYVGYANATITYTPGSRRSRPRHKGLFEAIRLAAGIIVTNSIQPLALVAWLGLCAAGLSGLYLLYVVGIWLFHPQVVAGWTTLSAVMAVLFGVLALSASVMAAYLARILEEQGDRPMYFVLEERTASTPDVAAGRRNVVTDSTP